MFDLRSACRGSALHFQEIRNGLGILHSAWNHPDGGENPADSGRFRCVLFRIRNLATIATKPKADYFNASSATATSVAVV